MTINAKSNIGMVIAAIIGVIASIMALFGINIPPELVDTFATAVVAIISAVVALIAYFTGKKEQT